MKKKHFGTDGIRGIIGTSIISSYYFFKIGHSIGRILTSKKIKSKIVVGIDTRVSSFIFESYLVSGLFFSGIDILFLGQMSTPAVSYLVKFLKADFGIIITASHNSYVYNGIKIFNCNGIKLFKNYIYKIEFYLNNFLFYFNYFNFSKLIKFYNLIGYYINFFFINFINIINFKIQKIIIDCSNGSMYKVINYLSKKVNFDIKILFNIPDGLNINKSCGSTFPEVLSLNVIEKSADIGIAFDGDGDRLLIVDSDGSIISGDCLLYIISIFYLKIGIFYGNGIVCTTLSSLNLKYSLYKFNISVFNTDVGDQNILRKLYKSKLAFGGEISGHFISLIYNSSCDGLVSFLLILSALNFFNKSLFYFSSNFFHFYNISFNFKKNFLKSILNYLFILSFFIYLCFKLKKNIRIVFRISGTEFIVRIMVEGFCFFSIKNIMINFCFILSKIYVCKKL